MKNINKIFRIMSLAIVVVISLCLFTSSIDEQSDSGMLFWEVKDKDGGTGKIYLLGSIHITDDSVYPLNNIVMSAYEESDALAVECDITKIEKDIEMVMQAAKAYVYNDNTTIKDHIDENLFNEAKVFLKTENSYNDSYIMFKPMFWADLIQSVLIEKTDFDPKKGIDRHFIIKAKDDTKEIIEIESIMEQVNLMSSLSDEVQEFYLKNILKSKETYALEINSMFLLWKDGDPDKLNTFLITENTLEFTPEEVKYNEELQEKIVDNRNNTMTDKAIEYIKTGKVYFYVVGAAHMVGNTGIVKQLQDAGYEVVKR